MLARLQDSRGLGKAGKELPGHRFSPHAVISALRRDLDDQSSNSADGYRIPAQGRDDKHLRTRKLRGLPRQSYPGTILALALASDRLSSFEAPYDTHAIASFLPRRMGPGLWRTGRATRPRPGQRHRALEGCGEFRRHPRQHAHRLRPGGGIERHRRQAARTMPSPSRA